MTNIENWRHYLKDLESPDLFIDWTFYSMITAALQRRVWYYDEKFALYPNLFIFLVGPPATGKSRVISQTGQIFKAPEMKWMNPNCTPPMEEDRFPLGADRITKEKLALDLSRVPKIIFRVKGGVKIPYVSAPKYFILEELGTMLGKKADDIVDVLNQLYDSRDYLVQTKGQGDDFVRNVCVSILAGTTPSYIQQSFSVGVMSQGFTSRIILVYANAPRFFREFPGLADSQKEALKKITDHIKDLHDKPVFGQVKLSPEAEKYHKDIYESGELYEKRLNTDFRLDDYYGRKKVHWLKTALAVHFADSTAMVIEKSSLVVALELLEKTEKEMHRCFSSSGVGSAVSVMENVYRKIQTGGVNGVKVESLFLHFYKLSTKREDIQNALMMLVDGGKIDIGVKPGVGKVYVAKNLTEKSAMGDLSGL